MISDSLYRAILDFNLVTKVIPLRSIQANCSKSKYPLSITIISHFHNPFVICVSVVLSLFLHSLITIRSGIAVSISILVCILIAPFFFL